MKQTGDQDATMFPRRVGEELAAARASQQLDLALIAERTRIPLRHLAAIEKGDHSALPAPTYSIGFVRSYARELGLDEADLATRFRAEVGMTERPSRTAAPFEPADPARVPTRLLALVTLAIALLLALSYGIWRSGIMSGDTAEDRQRLAAGTADEQIAPVAAGEPTPLSGAAPGAPAAGPVALSPTEKVWIKVYQRDGKTLFMGELPVGERYIVPTDAVEPLLTTGRPQSLRVTVGDVAVPPLGDGSRTITGVSLTPAALQGATAPQNPVSNAAPTP